MDKGRVLAITDGIVAIAATIMVLELSIPEELTLESLQGQWPTFFAFLVSFAQIYISWRAHHNAFQKAENVTAGVFLTNGVWLLFVSLIPFATGLIGRFPDSRIAAVVYVLVVSIWTVSFQFLDLAITRANPGAPKNEVRCLSSRLIIFGGYAIALVMGFVLPRLSIFVIAASSVLIGIRLFRTKRTQR